MINIMYLVLTALLALNVSKEVLNAFQVVDTSLQKSIKITDYSTSQIMESFQEKMKGGEQIEKAKIWNGKALQAINLCKAAYDDIENAKKELLTAKDTAISKDNLDASHHLFITNKKGNFLYDRMVQLQKDLAAIDSSLTPIIPNLATNIFKSDPDKSKWIDLSFNSMPTVATLTILTKLQNDIKGTENKVVAECHNKIGKIIIPFNNYNALVSQSSNYFMPGEKIIITGGLGAYSSAFQPTVMVNGNAIPVDNGKGTIQLEAGAEGKHEATVVVKFKNQDGIEQLKTETIHWTVGKLGTASIAAELMNAIYIGVDNPMKVGSSAGWDKTTVDWAGLSYSGSNGNFIITPSAGPEREVKFTVNSDNKPTTLNFRLKYLPPPTSYIGNNKNGGYIKVAILKAQGGISAVLENTPFNATYYITEYNVATVGKKGYRDASNKGNRWTGKAEALIKETEVGDKVYFTGIKAMGPDKREILVANPNLSFTLN